MARFFSYCASRTSATPEPTGGTPREAVNSSRSQSNSVSSVQTVTGGSGWSSGRT